MNISEPVEKSVLSAKAKDILLNKGIVTIGELFSAKGKQFSEIITENSNKMCIRDRICTVTNILIYRK